MNDITVDKSQLIEIVENNKSDHRAKFEEAWEAWRNATVENFNNMIARLKNKDKPQKVSVTIGLTQPEDHTEDYDRAIQMLRMHVDDTINLSEGEFAQLVQNDWGWERQFASTYSQTTGKAYGKFGY